ncbi:hypothetical protein ANCCAN_20095 [Ancylostoma caninum]|uniref:Uncharacterized protein n=1 Tax=Ancylostoma caninum TaxID=29170 RepID=A0A368FPA3_ANCCA|nr:hypothetical protein ANCCAN_20095 [Ancylostoma caninum]
MSRFLGKGKETLEDKTKRKRRPVSAVFSSAIHRLSSTTSVANKRVCLYFSVASAFESAFKGFT